MPNTDRLTRTSDPGAACPKCRESFTIKSACINTKWSTEYQTLRWTEDTNTQVQHIVMNSQQVPKVVEVKILKSTQWKDKCRGSEVLGAREDPGR